MGNTRTKRKVTPWRCEVKVKAKVKLHEEGKWEIIPIRWIDINKEGRPERVCGVNGLQYEEFELIWEEE